MANYWLKYRGTRFPLRRGETLIGRSPYCSIVISSSLVSREHTSLRLDGDSLLVADLGSTNGTIVNGEPLESPRLLKSGDVIRIGSDLLEVLLAEQPTGRTAIKTRSGQHTPPGADAPDASSSEGDSTTATSFTTLELIEALLASANESEQPRVVVPAIQRGVNELLGHARETGQKFERAEALRLAVVIERVAAWFPEHDLDAWREASTGALRKLQA